MATVEEQKEYLGPAAYPHGRSMTITTVTMPLRPAPPPAPALYDQSYPAPPPAPGVYQQSYPAPGKYPEGPGHLYMICTLLSCLCFFPVGMFSAICCWQTYDKEQKGNIAGANSAARWTIIISSVAIVMGMLVLVLGLSLGLTVGM